MPRRVNPPRRKGQVPGEDDVDYKTLILEEKDAIATLSLNQPDRRNASFGTYNVLWQIEQCRALALPYLYLGYWIRESPKMAYKSKFEPIEGFVGGAWRRLGHRA